MLIPEPRFGVLLILSKVQSDPQSVITKEAQPHQEFH